MPQSKTADDSFGRRLKELREAKRLTHGELAQASGLQRTAIHKYEAGTQPTWPTVVALADALGVSVETFRPEGERLENRVHGTLDALQAWLVACPLHPQRGNATNGEAPKSAARKK